jgi:hypothetical protein
MSDILVTRKKTIAAIRSQFFWPGMKKDVVDYIPDVWNVRE